jgi:hypothetical protein
MLSPRHGSTRSVAHHNSFYLRPPLHHSQSQRTPSRLPSVIFDVDFEQVEPRKSSADPSRMSSDDADTDDAELLSTTTAVITGSKNLFDLSLESDPDWNKARIPFLYGDNYIDAKLAFMVDLDGVSYGIAVPFDHAVALTFETKDGAVEYLSPDFDENDELLEIMAVQVKEHLGEDDLRLKRTPRVLTIAGPLDKYTKNWQDDLLPEPVAKESLLDDSDEDLDFFRSFMREELGEDEYQKTLKESPDGISEDLLALFNVPGLGDQKDDVKGMEAIIDSMLKSPEEQYAEMEELLGTDLSREGAVALRLIGYNFPDGKSYSLVQLLKPYALVGRYVPDDEEIRFELLTPEEYSLIVPRLEEVCEKDLEKAGLTLQ